MTLAGRDGTVSVLLGQASSRGGEGKVGREGRGEKKNVQEERWHFVARFAPLTPRVWHICIPLIRRCRCYRPQQEGGRVGGGVQGGD